MPDHELDVRPMPKPDKHPAIFKAFADLAAGESLVLVNDHDPRHLRLTRRSPPSSAGCPSARRHRPGERPPR